MNKISHNSLYNFLDTPCSNYINTIPEHITNIVIKNEPNEDIYTAFLWAVTLDSLDHLLKTKTIDDEIQKLSY